MPQALSGKTPLPKYDVSVSFLSRDEAIAKPLYDGLSDGLSVFFFPHSQKELAGTNGLESMRQPFFESRIVVVLFRDPWGQTPWTRIESTAIQERCLQQGWTGLVFVQLDNTSALPAWLPQTQVRFGFEEYGIDQLIGVTKARVQEHGGRITPPTAMSEARRVQREAVYLQDRENLKRDQRWIEQTVHSAIQEILAAIVVLAELANVEHGFQIQARHQGQSCVMRSGWVSMLITWRQPFTNTVNDDLGRECCLRVVEFSGSVVLPGEASFPLVDSRLLQEHKFKVEIAESRELVWVQSGKPGFIACGMLPDVIVRLFLHLISRANQGRVDRPDF